MVQTRAKPADHQSFRADHTHWSGQGEVQNSADAL